ncbi:MAG TPA: nucleotidyltransferase domain-containing protein [Burkholderiales bacterium]|nr:nucleotidyltransferase domain-containing protein [Burkholderiales bacterium]
MPKMGMKAEIKGKPPKRPAPKAAARTSLADALFSKTQQRVLGLLFGQPQRSFFATEVIGLVGAGSGAVQRELKRLTESGLLSATRVGNQRHYQAAQNSPLFSPLREIILKTSGLAEPLHDALAPLERRIEAACIYGSIASGTDTAQSDIDLLVISDDLNLEDLYAALTRVEKRLARPINPTLYSTAEFRKRKKAGNAFLSKLLNGPVLKLIGDIHALA